MWNHASNDKYKQRLRFLLHQGVWRAWWPIPSSNVVIYPSTKALSSLGTNKTERGLWLFRRSFFGTNRSSISTEQQRGMNWRWKNVFPPNAVIVALGGESWHPCSGDTACCVSHPFCDRIGWIDADRNFQFQLNFFHLVFDQNPLETIGRKEKEKERPGLELAQDLIAQIRGSMWSDRCRSCFRRHHVYAHRVTWKMKGKSVGPAKSGATPTKLFARKGGYMTKMLDAYKERAGGQHRQKVFSFLYRGFSFILAFLFLSSTTL